MDPCSLDFSNDYPEVSDGPTDSRTSCRWYYEYIEHTEMRTELRRKAYSYGDGLYLTPAEFKPHAQPDRNHARAFSIYRLSQALILRIHAPCLQKLMQGVPRLLHQLHQRSDYHRFSAFDLLGRFDHLIKVLEILTNTQQNEAAEALHLLLYDCLCDASIFTGLDLSHQYAEAKIPPSHLAAIQRSRLHNDLADIDQHMTLALAADTNSGTTSIDLAHMDTEFEIRTDRPDFIEHYLIPLRIACAKHDLNMFAEALINVPLHHTTHLGSWYSQNHQRVLEQILRLTATQGSVQAWILLLAWLPYRIPSELQIWTFIAAVQASNLGILQHMLSRISNWTVDLNLGKAFAIQQDNLEVLKCFRTEQSFIDGLEEDDVLLKLAELFQASSINSWFESLPRSHQAGRSSSSARDRDDYLLILSWATVLPELDLRILESSDRFSVKFSGYSSLAQDFAYLHGQFQKGAAKSGASALYRNLAKQFDRPLSLYQVGFDTLKRFLNNREAPLSTASIFGAVLLADAMRRIGRKSGAPDPLFRDHLSFMEDIGPWYAQVRRGPSRKLFEEMARFVWGWDPEYIVDRGAWDSNHHERLTAGLCEQLMPLISEAARVIRDGRPGRGRRLDDVRAQDIFISGTPDREQMRCTSVDGPEFESGHDPPGGCIPSGASSPTARPARLRLTDSNRVLMAGCIFAAFIGFLLLCSFGQPAIDRVSELSAGLPFSGSLCSSLGATIVSLYVYCQMVAARLGSIHLLESTQLEEVFNPTSEPDWVYFSTADHQPWSLKGLFPLASNPNAHGVHTTMSTALATETIDLDTEQTLGQSSSFLQGADIGSMPWTEDGNMEQVMAEPDTYSTMDWATPLHWNSNPPSTTSPSSGATSASLSLGPRANTNKQDIECEKCHKRFTGSSARSNKRRHQRVGDCRVRGGARISWTCRWGNCGRNYTRKDNRDAHDRECSHRELSGLTALTDYRV